MAYMNQAKKKVIAGMLKEVLPKDWKGSLSVENHSTIVYVIKSAPVDLHKVFMDDMHIHIRDGHIPLNHHAFWLEKQLHEGETLNTILAILKVLNHENYDNSDSQSDYFDVGHYVSLSFGRWNKPFINASK